MNEKEPTIQVGILTAPEIKFVLNGNFSTPVGKVFSGNQQALAQDGKVWFDNQLFDELIIEPTTEDASFDLIDVVIGIGFHWERKENQRFRGAIKLIVDSGQLIVINRINVEDYLTSVISSEMSATASDEFLKAHAVISRSWLLCPLQEQRTKNKEQRQLSETRTINYKLSTINYTKWYERDAHIHFDVCADDHCQRYQGIPVPLPQRLKKP